VLQNLVFGVLLLCFGACVWDLGVFCVSCVVSIVECLVVFAFMLGGVFDVIELKVCVCFCCACVCFVVLVGCMWASWWCRVCAW